MSASAATPDRKKLCPVSGSRPLGGIGPACTSPDATGRMGAQDFRFGVDDDVPTLMRRYKALKWLRESDVER
jgi:hypothetical protein